MKGVVSVAQGRLRGVWRGDLWSFSGIPYAPGAGRRAALAPAVGRPKRGSEVRDASTFGPIAPQSAAVPGITSPSDPAASEPHSEDCLSLNVWTPHLPESPTTQPGRGRPVMVFIHGGGFTSGSGSVFLYRGGNLVRNGDAVVVTINYRLGALGFLGHRDLADPDGLVGQLGHPGPGGCPGVGARQHRGLRRRSGATSPSSASRPAGSAWRRCSARPQPRDCSGAPSCRAAACTCTRSRRRSDRPSAWRPCSGIASCNRESLERVPATELVAATEEIGKTASRSGHDAACPSSPWSTVSSLPEHPLAAVANGGRSRHRPADRHQPGRADALRPREPGADGARRGRRDDAGWPTPCPTCRPPR